MKDSAIYQEIFEKKECEFSCSGQSPFIIDCGSHIGMSVLYFKREYPDAKIIAFEPDPNNFQILMKNIRANSLGNVTATNAALATCRGRVAFYGQIHGDSPDTRGNSIMRYWGDRGNSDRITVNAVRLSSYIQGPVDYLKLDIEGAEQQVLEDIQNKLKYVRDLYVELHETSAAAEETDLDLVVTMLRNSSFEVRVTYKDMETFLPEELRDWFERVNPRIAVVRASNLSLKQR